MTAQELIDHLNKFATQKHCELKDIEVTYKGDSFVLKLKNDVK